MAAAEALKHILWDLVKANSAEITNPPFSMPWWLCFQAAKSSIVSCMALSSFSMVRVVSVHWLEHEHNKGQLWHRVAATFVWVIRP